MIGSLYRYTARTVDGRSVRGALAAADEDAVLAALRSRALVVTGVRRERHAAADVRPQRRQAPRTALIAFFRGFAALTRAGVPARRALGVAIARGGDRRLLEALHGIAADIEQGFAFADAMARRPRTFGPLAVAMVRAGEAAGALDDALARVATLLESDADLRRTLRAAFAYPAVVIVVAALVSTFVVARVVPLFGELLASLHAEPPPSTRVLLGIAAVLNRPATWTAAVTSGVAVLVVAAAVRRTARGAAALDALRLRLPVVGRVARAAIAARVARTLAGLLGAGIDVLTALETTAPVAGSVTYRDALRRVGRGVATGEPLSAQLHATRLFDPLVTTLAHAGEESGALDELLVSAAAYLEAEARAAIATASAVLEPALLLGLGVVVGFIAVSVFFPLYAVLGSVSS